MRVVIITNRLTTTTTKTKYENDRQRKAKRSGSERARLWCSPSNSTRVCWFVFLWPPRAMQFLWPKNESETQEEGKTIGWLVEFRYKTCLVVMLNGFRFYSMAGGWNINCLIERDRERGLRKRL